MFVAVFLMAVFVMAVRGQVVLADFYGPTSLGMAADHHALTLALKRFMPTLAHISIPSAS